MSKISEETNTDDGVGATIMLTILLDFIVLAIGSLVIGLFFGLLASYMLKKMDFITSDALKETLVIFSIGYMAYAVGELAHMSGIICLLTSGVIIAHYGWYNLSPQGKNLSSAAIQVIGFALEAFVFAYLGISFFSLSSLDWSPHFIIVEFFICIIARLGGTVLLLYMTAICKHKRKVSFRQLLFISYAGMIRGAIAFGLVLKLNKELVSESNLGVIKTTALTLVVGTTLLYGSTMSIFQRILVPPLSEIQLAQQMLGKELI